MQKFQVTIQFDVTEEFMALVPAHRVYINQLIEKGIIDQYVVSMEAQKIWITFTAESKADVLQHLSRSPLHNYWQYEIHELFVYDGQHYRLPVLQMN